MYLQKIIPVLLSVLLVLLAGPVLTAGESGDRHFNDTVTKIRSGKPAPVKRFIGSPAMDPYAVVVHSEQMALAMKGSYTLDDINRLLDLTRQARRIDVVTRDWGTFVEAASFESEEMDELTNYDAIWVRDSVWGYLALAAEESRRDDAKKVLLTLLDYMVSEDQIQRMRRAVSKPSLLEGEAGDMNAVHIRFDSRTKNFADVMENGKPQAWKHKQNDALGLLIDATVDAYRDGLVTLADLEENDRLVGMAGLIAYLDAAQFYQMEDSGAWEEIARRNTSSIALVTSAVANLYHLLESADASTFAESFEKAAETFGVPQAAQRHTLAHMMFNGYEVIRFQLAQGGESPDYEQADEHFREADAALLNLVYPARLDRLTADFKLTALDMVATLMGDYGICRYRNDDYQSANFWFKGIKTDANEASYEEREKNFIPGTEAQWFFDSWMATCALYMYEETGDPLLLPLATRHLNRALGQITGSASGMAMISADGKPAKDMILPESYNFLMKDNELFAAPSPIAPLNWAKASLTLALKNFRRILEEERREHTARK